MSGAVRTAGEDHSGTSIYSKGGEEEKEREGGEEVEGMGVSFVSPEQLQATGQSADFDVVVELSGRMAGLQTALDCTRPGGRVVVGSLYSGDQNENQNASSSSSSSSLRLGLRFHRSRINIVASQVSEVQPALSLRWSKQRRFESCWQLIKELSPSRLLLDGEIGSSSSSSSSSSRRRVLTQQDVQDAFDALDKGECLTALFVSTYTQPPNP